jgi:hypothetical protein
MFLKNLPLITAILFWIFGAIIVGLILRMFELGFGIAVIGSCFYSLWLAKALRTDEQRLITLMWTLFQLLLPLLPFIPNAATSFFRGSDFDTLMGAVKEVLSGEEAYFYSVFLGIAAVGLIVETFIVDPSKWRALVGPFVLSLIFALIALTLTGLVFADKHALVERRLLILEILLVGLIPANISARIRSLI